MNTPHRIPFYAKSSLIFMGILTLVAVLYIAQGIIVPLIYATILAIVLSPVVDFLVSKNVNRVVAITLTILIVVVVIFFLIVIVLSQIGMFSEALPGLLTKFDLLVHQIELWLSVKL